MYFIEDGCGGQLFGGWWVQCCWRLIPNSPPFHFHLKEEVIGRAQSFVVGRGGWGECVLSCCYLASSEHAKKERKSLRDESNGKVKTN